MYRKVELKLFNSTFFYSFLFNKFTISNHSYMFRHFFFSAIAVCWLTYTQAQTDVDALNYARIYHGSTARALGVGGAFGALGGDISTYNINPAGLGVFRTSELVLSPGFLLSNVESEFGGESNSTNYNKFRFGSVGAAFAKVNENPEDDWKTFNFGFGYNQLANFDKRFSYRGSTAGTISESFLERANGLFPEQLNSFYEGLAYDTDFIFNPDENDLTSYAADLGAGNIIEKRESFTSEGSLYELAFALAGNYRHKLFFGGTLGLPILNYRQNTLYREVDDEDQYPIFNSVLFEERFNTTGIGINFKLGAIYRINRMYRVGLAIHTPTRMTLTDEFSVEMSTNLTYDQTQGPVQNVNEVVAELVDYELRNPWRVVASGAAIIKKMGFVSADVEWVNYGGSRYSFDTDLYPGFTGYADEVNGLIKDKYTHALNVRLGAEYVYKLLRVRAGYAYYGSPFAADIETIGAVRQNLSFGLGIRPNSIYLDLAVIRSLQKELYVPYTTVASPNSQEVNNQIGLTNIMATVGLKF